MAQATRAFSSPAKYSAHDTLAVTAKFRAPQRAWLPATMSDFRTVRSRYLPERKGNARLSTDYRANRPDPAHGG